MAAWGEIVFQEAGAVRPVPAATDAPADAAAGAVPQNTPAPAAVDGAAATSDHDMLDIMYVFQNTVKCPGITDALLRLLSARLLHAGPEE